MDVFKWSDLEKGGDGAQQMGPSRAAVSTVINVTTITIAAIIIRIFRLISIIKCLP